MKVLVCVPHFYDAQAHHLMGSSQDPAAARAETVSFCLRRVMSLLTEQQFLIGTRDKLGNDLVAAVGNPINGDVCVCVHEDKHLLDAMVTGMIVKRRVSRGDPRFLGFECRRVFAEHLEDYDLFCFVEDDTAILDGEFFGKIAAFHARFGEDRVLLPSRYELFGRSDLAWKSYLDREHPPLYRIEADMADEPALRWPSYGGDVVLERTSSVHAGCYVITREQLRWWREQPDFLALDPTLGARMDPMEVAQIPLRGRRPVYKPGPANLAFLEVHHVPNRAINGKTPNALLRAAAGPEIEARKARSL